MKIKDTFCSRTNDPPVKYVAAVVCSFIFYWWIIFYRWIQLALPLYVVVTFFTELSECNKCTHSSALDRTLALAKWAGIKQFSQAAFKHNVFGNTVLS